MQPTETEERNLTAVSDVLAYWNVQDIPGVLAFYDDEIVWTNVALGEVYRGKQEVGAFIGKLFTAFPDFQFAVSDKMAHGDQVAEQWRITGTHDGPFMGVPPTGRPIEILGMSMVTMRDGRFLRDQFYFDAAGVLQQMGLFPPLSIGETKVGKLALWAAVNRLKVAASLGTLAASVFAVRTLRPNRRQNRSTCHSERDAHRTCHVERSAAESKHPKLEHAG
jgi:steroid delta-isomerase-like uncharacterized protein